jgi:hypothetical protein
MLLWSGQTVSEIGSQITVLALPLVAVVVLRASTFQIGLLSAAETSAYLLVSLPAGALVGRLGKRQVMLWCDAARLALIESARCSWCAPCTCAPSTSACCWRSAPSAEWPAASPPVGVRPTLWIAVVGGCSAGLWLFFSPLRGMRDFPATPRPLAPA